MPDLAQQSDQGRGCDGGFQHHQVALQFNGLNLSLRCHGSLHRSMGRIGWSKLREVARVASPETESVWLKLCAKRTYRQIERLTALTGYGQWPGEKLPTQRSSDLTELPLTLDPEAQHHLIRARSHLAA